MTTTAGTKKTTTSSTSEIADGLSIISLASPTATQEIDHACSTWGAFVLVDHGLDERLCDQVLDAAHEFFKLPYANKNKYNLQKYGAKWRGYMPLGGERSVHGIIQDAKEGLYLGDEHEASNARMGLPTFGTNVFPDQEVPQMRQLFLTYHEEMRTLGNRMMDVLSQALSLPSDDYLQQHITRHDPVILPRCFRYIPQEEATQSPTNTTEDPSEGDNKVDDENAIQWGIGRHSDYGLWTMILTDAPGLEFQHHKTKQWHAVPFVKSGIIMNVGDVLDRLTAGRYISSYHRARNHSTTDFRLSLPFFYDPAWDACMKTLPMTTTTSDSASLANEELDTSERAERWSHTKITCEFDGSVEYSEFLAKKVAKVFPDLVPESVWKNLSSTSEPSTRHALVVRTNPDAVISDRVQEEVRKFYHDHRARIKESHGLAHILAVLNHANKAIECHEPPLSPELAMQIRVAALLHDTDDHKYFPKHEHHENARMIMEKAEVLTESILPILEMIDLVSCSQNGNSVPASILEKEEYYRLIPRWSDRLEAVGAIGVVRCYQYNQELGRPLSSPSSPRAHTADQVWEFATPERFEAYQERGGTSDDMISHYYDKLLHVACPPIDLVRNAYLEDKAKESSKELVELCLRFGKTGTVDESYIQEVNAKLLAV
eukprot:scaffold29367_cov53-Attheya_sp.AAC.1